MIERTRKSKSTFRTPLQNCLEEVLAGSIRNYISTKDLRNWCRKMSDNNCRLATGRNSGFQGENKQKENHVQHVLYTWGMFQSEECWYMVKQLVLCKNSFKLATSRKVKTFLEAWEIIIKEQENLEIIKEFKMPFLKKINTGESFSDVIHGLRTRSSNTSG